MGGAIVKFLAEGLAVGVLDLTDGEPTPHGSPEIRRRETAEATRVLGAALARESPACRTARWSRRYPRGRAGRGFPPHAAAMGFRSLLDRRPSRPRRRHATDRGRPVLVETGPRPTCPASRSIPSESSITTVSTCECFRSRPSCSTSAISGKRSVRLSTVTAASSSKVIRKTCPPSSTGLHDQAAFWGSLIGARYGEPFASREPVALATMKGMI